MVNQTRGQWGNFTMQTARVQAAVTSLGTTGVDVSEPLADITNGNLTAAMQWLMAYHKDHPVNQKGDLWGNSTAQGHKGGFMSPHKTASGSTTSGQS